MSAFFLKLTVLLHQKLIKVSDAIKIEATNLIKYQQQGVSEPWLTLQENLA
jgi:hypothetical protein